MRDWIIANPEPVQNRNNKLIPFQTSGKSVKTGWDVIKDGVETKEYEFGKSVQNLIHSYLRLVASIPTP